ncbi:MAG: YbaB/EbfC family nucleoid-associated protein [Candidatus Peribacteraceae bacterium]|nr:YbaB/EbfC family nucleoid-associated protein [Candidatus Peribacteraceae bacterium]MBP9850064.1 YbaB/EbfC family nucleoid-associated protein [Candidatus Peribacteraceae bacterium]
MTSFSELRNSFKFQRQASKVQKELKNIHVEAEASGVHVVVSAAMEIISVTVAPEVQRERIGELLKDALNRAMKKAQIVSAERMQGVMGELGLGVKG